MATKIFAENFRGFESVDLTLDESAFLVGDNSSGKTSILHLIDFVLSTDLDGPARLNDSNGLGPYDFFSPYFGLADVTIGMNVTRADGTDPAWKVITLTRRKDNAPKVITVTSARGSLIITLVSKPSGAKIRVRQFAPGTITQEAVMASHRDHLGMKAVKLNVERQLSLNSPVTAHICVQRGLPHFVEHDDLPNALFIEAAEGVRHLGPLRGKAERYYQPDRRYIPSGAHFAPMLRDVRGPKAQELKAAIDKFGLDSKLFEGFEVQPVSRAVPESPLLVTVTKNEQQFLIHQVGVGVSQVAPIIVEATFSVASKSDNVLLVQQPELHLHPIAQAALGEFLFKVHGSGVITYCETHSDYLIDRYRSLVRNSDGPSLSSIIYCHSDARGNHATRIRITEDGKLEGAPDKYFDFFIDEFARTSF